MCLGGSNYRPSGSHWYFPNQIELNTHNKYFLFSDGYERAATIGVRCVKDRCARNGVNCVHAESWAAQAEPQPPGTLVPPNSEVR